MFPCVKGKGRSKTKSSYWGATTQVMAPAIGQLALNNGSCGSISKDWVALPPQNTQTEKQKISAFRTGYKKDTFSHFK